MARRTLALALIMTLASSAACSSDLAPGTEAHFGGNGFALMVTDTLTEFRFPCAVVRVPYRVSGSSFSLQDTLHFGYGQFRVSIDGVLSPQFVAVTMSPGWPGADSVGHFSARRDASADLGSGICLA